MEFYCWWFYVLYCTSYMHVMRRIILIFVHHPTNSSVIFLGSWWLIKSLR